MSGSHLSEKVVSGVRIDGAFFLVTQYNLRNICANFQLDGNFVQVEVKFQLILPEKKKGRNYSSRWLNEKELDFYS